MQMLRIVLRDEVFLGDTADILRSMDELAKIITWAGIRSDPLELRSVTRGRT